MSKVYFKTPKSQAGRRSLSLAPFVVLVLREHRAQVLEQRLKLRLGKLPEAALVFSDVEASRSAPTSSAATGQT